MRASPTPISTPLWRALRAASEPQPIDALLHATGVNAKSARFQLRRWVCAGLIDATHHHPRRYRMIDKDLQPPMMSGNAVARRGPSQRQRMWTAIRILKRFDLVELRMTSEVPRGSAVSYLTSLMRAGYVRQVAPCSGRHGRLARYVVVERSGPVAPIVSQTRVAGQLQVTLVDPNNGQRTDISPGAVAIRRPRKASPCGWGED